MSQFVDKLGNPIDVGDVIVKAVSNGSSATSAFYRVAEIIPLGERVASSGRQEWVREDQAHKHDAASYRPPRTGAYNGPIDLHRAYVLRCHSYNPKKLITSDKKQFVSHISEVIVVTSLVRAHN